MLVSSGKDGTIILWSADGTKLQDQALPKHALHTVDISPHGMILAAGMAQSAKSSKDARGASRRLSCLSAPVSRTSVDGYHTTAIVQLHTTANRWRSTLRCYAYSRVSAALALYDGGQERIVTSVLDAGPRSSGSPFTAIARQPVASEGVGFAGNDGVGPRD